MKKMQTRMLVEASLLAALAAAIIVLTAYVPILALIGIIAWSIPITLLTFKYDIKISLLAMVVALILASLLVNPLTALYLGVTFGISAIVLGYCLRKGYSPFITIIIMAITMFVVNLADIELSILLTGVDPIKDTLKMFDESLKMSLDMMKSLGISQEQIDATPYAKMSSETIKPILPGFMALGSVMGAYFNYYIVQVIFRKLRYTIVELKPLDEWYIGNSLSFGIFFITIAAMLLGYMKVPNADIVYTSVFIIFIFAFVIDGLAVLAWFLKSRGIARGFRIFILIFVVFSGLGQFLIFLGLIDYVFDFRKINPWRRRRIPPRE